VSDLIGSIGRVEIRVFLGGDDGVVVGSKSWISHGNYAAEASRILTAWDQAGEQAERTLRAYGAEGLMRAIAERGQEVSDDAERPGRDPEVGGDAAGAGRGEAGAAEAD